MQSSLYESATRMYRMTPSQKHRVLEHLASRVLHELENSQQQRLLVFLNSLMPEQLDLVPETSIPVSPAACSEALSAGTRVLGD